MSGNADPKPIYVFDTNSFRVTGNYYPDTFPSFWNHFNGLVESGRLMSVWAVRKELEAQNTSAHLEHWLHTCHQIFSKPTEQEMACVTRIFQVRHFQQLIGKKQLLRGGDVADPWLVARGMTSGGIVVTEESPKPNAANIPAVCGHFGVRCASIREALASEGWRY